MNLATQTDSPCATAKTLRMDVLDFWIQKIGFFDHERLVRRTIRFARNVMAVVAHPLQDLCPLSNLKTYTVGTADAGGYESDPSEFMSDR